MQYYNKYVVVQRFKQQRNSICGDVNLPYGTECQTISHGSERAIVCDAGILCYVSSQNAFDYFAQNDDEMGIERGNLVHKIVSHLRKLNQKPKQKDAVWEKIWNDSICSKYKRPEYVDTWLWNYDFYNADLHDLRHIAKLVGVK